MVSIALRHKQRCLEEHARKQAGVAPAGGAKTKLPPVPATPVQKVKANYERVVVEKELQRDLERLSALENVKDKIALKREHLLPKYLSHVQAYRDSGQHYPNELLVWCVIWLLDVEDMEPALDLAIFAIEQQQHMPERFKRDLPTYVAETVHDWAERQYKAHQSASPYFEQVLEKVAHHHWPVAQVIVLNKLYKLAGLFAEREGENHAAIAWFEKCEQVNPGKSGVKTILNRVRAKL